MVTYVLDASAILRYIEDEAGGKRVEEILKGLLAGKNLVKISAVHWGEVAGIIVKKHGMQALDTVLARLQSFGIEIIPATAERAVHSALIKVQRKIPYADAFGVDLASDSRQHIFVTADFDVKPAEQDVRIEFLSKK